MLRPPSVEDDWPSLHRQSFRNAVSAEQTHPWSWPEACGKESDSPSALVHEPPLPRCTRKHQQGPR